jgi:hypothetical protein
MGIRYKIRRAHTIIEQFDQDEADGMRKRCLEIQNAQNELVSAAKPFFKRCMTSCEGMCCRNICPDDIITLLDFIFILTIDSANKATLLEYAKEESMFTASCIFLKKGIGPCIFPFNLKPERCIITFCSDTHAINKEIHLVRKKFSRLYRFLICKKPLVWFGF